MSSDLKNLKECSNCGAFIEAREKSCEFCKIVFEIPILTEEEASKTYKEVCEELNNAFFRFENFMYGSATTYESFNFDRAFTVLFIKTRETKNYTPENFSLLNQYWSLTNQIQYDLDKCNFDNTLALDNTAFETDSNSICAICHKRLHEFLEFSLPEDITTERRLSIVDIKAGYSAETSKDSKKTDGSAKSKKKKVKSSKEIQSLQEFFYSIRNSDLSNFEIHHKAESLTANFDLRKLQLLVEDFENYLFKEKEKFDKSITKEQIEKVVDLYHKYEYDLYYREPIYNYEFDMIFDNHQPEGKFLDLERMIYSQEFVPCYKFKAMLIDEISKKTTLQRDYSNFDIKLNNREYDISFQDIVIAISQCSTLKELEVQLFSDCKSLGKAIIYSYKSPKEKPIEVETTVKKWFEIIRLISSNEFQYTNLPYFKLAIKWCDENEKQILATLVLDILNKTQNNINNEKTSTVVSNIYQIQLSRLKSNLEEFGFLSIDKIQTLDASSVHKVYELLSENNLPYKIALLDYLGLINHLQKNYCNTKDKTYSKLSEILKEDFRSVKGNILVLNSLSKENRTRYTAHNHKENVERDYQSLK